MEYGMRVREEESERKREREKEEECEREHLKHASGEYCWENSLMAKH